MEKEENGKEEKGKDGKGGRADGMRVKTKATDGQMEGLIGKKGWRYKGEAQTKGILGGKTRVERKEGAERRQTYTDLRLSK